MKQEIVRWLTTIRSWVSILIIARTNCEYDELLKVILVPTAPISLRLRKSIKLGWPSVQY